MGWVEPGVRGTSGIHRAPRLHVPHLHGAVAVGIAEDVWPAVPVAPMQTVLSRCAAEPLLQPVLPLLQDTHGETVSPWGDPAMRQPLLPCHPTRLKES